MLIDKYIVKGIPYKILPENLEGNNLITQVNFICLEKKVVENFRKIFSKYEISMNKIICYNYLKNLDNFNSENICKMAYDTIIGQVENEILIVEKTLKNQGFFEKFFNFFK